MTFLSVNFLRFLLFTSEARLKLSFWHLLDHVTVGSLYPSVTWYDITYDMGNERWQVTESEKKNHVSGSPLIYASVVLRFFSHIIFYFRDELGLVDSLSTLGFLNNLLNKAGCWVNCSLSTGFPNRDNLFLVWKSCPPTFRKRQLLSLTWVSIPFISCLFYRFTLFLIFNYGTFYGVACTPLFNIFKLQPRVVETRL